jgi:RNase P subunit RPR2
VARVVWQQYEQYPAVLRMVSMAPDQSLKALCHKCHTEMIYVTSLPHPRAPEKMKRTTFVCRACNQTRSYSLSISMAEAYATTAVPMG